MTRSTCLLAILAISWAPQAGARICPPAPGVPLPQAYLQYQQRNPDSHEFRRAWQRRRPDAQPKVALKQGQAVAGLFEVPLFLVRFANSPADPYAPLSLEEALFEPGSGRSMSDYYGEISQGKLQLDGTAYGWHPLPRDASYYTGTSNGTVPNNARIGDLILDTLSAYDQQVDFRQYDNDGPDGVPDSGDDDGYVDFVAFVHPQQGGECGGNANIWSHRWRYSAWPTSSGSPFVSDDTSAHGGPILIDDYTIQPGLACDASSQVKIGVFCHEFGHAFGLPDLYDTNGGGAGVGHWCLMASGNWNQSASPAHMSAWAKQQLGWVSTQTVDWRGTTLDIEPVLEAPIVYELPFHEERWARRSDGALDGSASLSVGLDATAAAARGFSGKGYGNSWRETAAHDFHFDGQGPVELGFRYALDSEAAFDFFFVLLQQGDAETTLGVYSGVENGSIQLDLTSVLQGIGPYRIAFRFVSDRWDSTEDAGYRSNCLPVVLDDIVLSGGGEDYRADFETHVGGWFSPRNANDNPVRERWLIENRQRLGFDQNLHAPGLLIYHVDDEVLGSALCNSGGASNLQARGLVVEEADGRGDLLKSGGGRGNAGDVWPSLTNTNFDALSLPSSASNSGLASGVAVRNIQALGAQIQVLALAGDPAPVFAGVAPEIVPAQDGSQWIDLVGEAFIRHDATIRLEGDGLPTLLAERVEWTDFNRVRAQFAFQTASDGNYDVVVANADGQSALQVGALVIEAEEPTEGPLLPLVVRLHQNAPNPFNPRTMIRFELPHSAQVQLQIFDARGRQLRTLVAETLPAGSHGAVWDGRDDESHDVASGLYFYRLRAGLQVLQNKMLVVR